MNKEWQGVFIRAGAATAALLVFGAGCAQLIGIKETEVTRVDGSGGGGGQSSNPPPNGMGGRGGSGTAGMGGSGTSGSGAGGTGVAAGGGGGMPVGGACTGTEARCGASGREVCTAGQWQSMPCPLTEPACEAGVCVLRGPALVQVPATVTSSFYIDATEVTVAQYTQFLLAKNGDVSGQPAECSWNTEYFDPVRAPNPGDWPITYVDWCDARAYCEWAGKHLCGHVGGGPIAQASVLVPTQSEWFLACGGPNGSPNLNDNDSNRNCNTPYGFSGLLPVGSLPLCEARYAGVFDLIGNAAEWIDSCGPGADAGADGRGDYCLLMGGGIFNQDGYPCSLPFEDTTRDYTNETFGFRCCSG